MKTKLKEIVSILLDKFKRSNVISIVKGGGMKTQLKKSFFTGLLVVIPISVTIYILVFLIGLLNNLLPFSFLPYGTGLVLTLILITLVGFMTSNLIGKRLIEVG